MSHVWKAGPVPVQLRCHVDDQGDRTYKIARTLDQVIKAAVGNGLNLG